MPADRPLRVTHVTTVPMSLMFLRGQTAYMRERGIELSFVSSPGPELDEFGAAEGAPTYAVPMERRITPLKDLVAVARLYRHFRSTKPDIVHAHTPKGGLLGTIAATLARVPTRIYHMRGLPSMGATGVKRTLLEAAERVSCGLASTVLCVSPSLREEAIRLDLVSPSRIRVPAGGSGQGVDTARFDPSRFGAEDRAAIRAAMGIPRDALVFGFVGRIVRDKGIHELAEAWAAVRAELPQAHLLLVGPFEPQDPVDPSVRAQLERDARVTLLGPTDDTPRAYAAMDVAVLPSYREGFPNVPLEAAAMELPVVATRIPGCVDAVEDGVTGACVAPRCASELKSAMLRYGTDPALRRRHGRAGRVRAQRAFRRETIWEAIAGVYLEGRRLDERAPPRWKAARAGTVNTWMASSHSRSRS